MCVKNLVKVTLDSAAAGIEPAMFGRKYRLQIIHMNIHRMLMLKCHKPAEACRVLYKVTTRPFLGTVPFFGVCPGKFFLHQTGRRFVPLF